MRVPAEDSCGNRGAFRIWELERALDVGTATLKALGSTRLFLQVRSVVLVLVNHAEFRRSFPCLQV